MQTRMRKLQVRLIHDDIPAAVVLSRQYIDVDDAGTPAFQPYTLQGPLDIKADRDQLQRRQGSFDFSTGIVKPCLIGFPHGGVR